MEFLTIYLNGLYFILGGVTILWIISVLIKNASIVDIGWGPGFVLAAVVYYYLLPAPSLKTSLLLILVAIWGLRLGIYLAIRNIGKGEDYRYQQFRQDYGPHRYWWVSFFQVFLLQGVLMWLISSAILGGMKTPHAGLKILDYVAIGIWLIGFFFESVGDLQLARFKANPKNKGKVLNNGLWKYTRHPNYFGDATVWLAYGLFSVASGYYWPLLGSALMIFLIIKISGVSLLERSLKTKREGYDEYIRKTSAFIPWFPKK